ncbi:MULTISPECIES: signal peptidase I [unclassified Arthrobacter]|uniref:signal peptidase I n=1 Tax=unclassified Arthrobacter TaxID=235627 RepID=UPI00159D5DB8|nr:MULTISPECIES: signal peptidase I [unclassified Arthrobacter]MCQ9163140.1 signal peptidase I [Arthrobacter sp. STN4]NVM99675.1 signal peptidase I [Arthrobacter sp. SDTb3-6]
MEHQAPGDPAQSHPDDGGAQEGARGTGAQGAHATHGAHVPEATALGRFSSSAWRWGREIVTILAIALVLSFLIKTFLFRAFYIPSGSMENTLRIDDRIFVNLLVPEPFALKRGDVVVFKDTLGWLPPQAAPTGPFTWIGDVATFLGLAPDSSQQHLVKRVIGLPGDHVKCCTAAGKMTVNGAALTEPYLFPGASPSDTTFDVTVPAGHIWVMGDHRNNSEDSRAHQALNGTGFVPISAVEGRAIVIAWPLNHLGILGNYPKVFADVPAPSGVGQGTSSGVVPAGK